MVEKAPMKSQNLNTRTLMHSCLREKVFKADFFIVLATGKKDYISTTFVVNMLI